MTGALSVTKVRVAFECPRLFYLGHKFGGMMLFQGDSTTVGAGKAFHALSQQVIQAMKQDEQLLQALSHESEQLQVETIAATLQERLYTEIFYPYLQATIQQDASKAPLLYQLWQALTNLIRRWAELLVGNRRHCPAQEVVAKTFLAQEMTVTHAFPLPNQTTQVINGQFDCLVYDFQLQRLCMVEYKTYKAIDPSAQLVQVALYSYMLQQQIGLPIDSTVYSVLPDWQEYTFSWNEMEKSVHQLLPHKLQQMQQWLVWKPSQPDPPPPTTLLELCTICPQYKKCQSFFTAPAAASTQPSQLVIEPVTHPSQPVAKSPKSLIVSPTKPTKPVVKSDSATQLGHRLVATLRSFGIETDYQGAAMGPAFMRVKLRPRAGVKVAAIVRLSDDLQVQMGLLTSPLIAPEAGYVSVDLPRPDRQIARFEQYLQRQTLPPTAPLTIAIGVDLEDRLVEADLSDPNTCHFLVGGTTGSGKSEFLRSLLLSLLVRHSPDFLKIVLVDPKRVTFPEFTQMPWLYQPVVKETDQAISLMQELVAEMEQRYQRFEDDRCADIQAYNGKVRKPLPRIVCVFDEYADFMAEKESAKELEQSIKRLGAMARAAGIHLIIATQRPEARVVTPLIRSNLPGRIALKTSSIADSTIILGGKHTAAANLLGKGDLLYLVGGTPLRLQSLFAQEVGQWIY